MATAEHDATRLEAFSDAVFGFAITLLVVSLEVPNSFDELMQVMRGLPVFAVTFAILLMIWQEHHNLFKRFPSSDGATIWLNGALLFVVVSYIYPLKFLFGQIVLPGGVSFGSGAAFQGVDQLVTLMVIYGAGFATIFLLFAAMYWRAARRVTEPARRHEARVLRSATRSFTSLWPHCRWRWRCSAARLPSAYSGVAYALIGPCQGLYHVLDPALLEAAASTAAGDGAPATTAGSAEEARESAPG